MIAIANPSYYGRPDNGSARTDSQPVRGVEAGRVGAALAAAHRDLCPVAAPLGGHEHRTTGWDHRVYSWDLRDPLPRLPIPLLEGEQAVLDQGACFRMAYDRLAADDKAGYDGDPPPPLAPADARWVDELLRKHPVYKKRCDLRTDQQRPFA